MGLVLFDGVCAMCNASVRFLIAIDKAERLRFAPLQGGTGRAVLSRHPEANEELSTMLYVRDPGAENEALYDRSEAVVEIFRDLGGCWTVLSWLRWCPRSVRDGVYRFVARHRYRWFGKYDACRVPDRDSSGRFLP